MSWILVEWTDEGEERSVIPVSWVITPKNLDKLPVDGAAYWRSKSNQYKARLLKRSNSKHQLEAEIDTLFSADAERSRSPVRKRGPSLPVDNKPTNKRTKKSTPKAAAAIEEGLASKAEKTKKKAKKDAVSASERETQNEIFAAMLKNMTAPCTNCKELEEQLRDARDAVEAKKVQIEHLMTQLAASKKPETSKFPSVSASHSSPNLDTPAEEYNIMFSDSESGGEETTISNYERMCMQNKEKNRNLLSQVMNKKNPPAVPAQSPPAEHDDIPPLPPPLKQLSSVPAHNGASHAIRAVPQQSEGMKTLVVKEYSVTLTRADIEKEAAAFVAGVGKREIVEGYGVYIPFVDLEHARQVAKPTGTGLMRELIGVFYSKEVLAGCSAKRGINPTIETVIFKYCQDQYPQVNHANLKRDLTSKCGEERRKIMLLRKKAHLDA